MANAFNMNVGGTGILEADPLKDDGTAGTVTAEQITTANTDVVSLAAVPNQPMQVTVTALAAGTATITASGTNSLGNTISSQCTITVAGPPPPPPPAAPATHFDFTLTQS